ncbi:protein translocase subunit SecF [Mahella sp.]|uniref:protein translocase subunit SecF n=1 Tax=Mahella sp. TaxID=2798721 RepID=UPI0025BDDFDA|nr:protein translocase subunit SecF [Mahella sp.]MBZ4666161.1 protein translocase subunit secF [Mahella sp.]MDK2902171.1 preprotein translocase subunit SecF [Clostridiales bacterium]
MKIIERRWIWYSISIAIIVVGIAFMLIRGLNFGIDFRGGTLMEVNIGKSYDVEDIRAMIKAHNVDAYVSQAGDNNQEVLIRIASVPNDDEVQAQILNDIKEKYGIDDSAVLSIEKVGPTVGGELTRNAIYAIAIACVLMLIYIWIRFEIRFGVAAIIALVHDVLIMSAAVAITNTQINTPFVAAVLTIVGYSINDTIVVFDRIRENRRKLGKKKMSPFELADMSIEQTLARSINTTLTTLFTITALYILGVPSIKEFALPIMIGLVSGAYSSIFIASPIWATWTQRDAMEKAAVHKR